MIHVQLYRYVISVRLHNCVQLLSWTYSRRSMVLPSFTCICRGVAVHYATVDPMPRTMRCHMRHTTNCSCGTALWCTPTRVRVHYSCSHRLTVPPTWSLQESTAPLADVCSTPVCLGMRRHICPDVQHARHLGTCIWQLTRQVHMHAPDALTHRAQNGL